MEYAIEINNLQKTYQKSKKSLQKDALKSIDLQIKKGSFFGLLGPNGAGKSTIINILAGLVKKTSGQVKISGIDIDENQKATNKDFNLIIAYQTALVASFSLIFVINDFVLFV